MELNFNYKIGERKCLVQRLRKLKKGSVLNAYKEGFLIRQKNEIFSQVWLDLYKVEEQKVQVMWRHFVGDHNSIEFKEYLGKGKEWVRRYNFNLLRFIKRQVLS